MNQEKFDSLVKEFVTASYGVFLKRGANVLARFAQPSEINAIVKGGMSFSPHVKGTPRKRPVLSGDEELYLAEVFTHIAQRIDGGEMLKNVLPAEVRCASFSSQALERNASEFAMLCITPKIKKL